MKTYTKILLLLFVSMTLLAYLGNLKTKWKFENQIKNTESQISEVQSNLNSLNK